MPAVVPQLKTITLGGAVAGVGIESSSHPPRPGARHGARARRAARRRPRRHLHARQRARGPLLRLPEFLRHARLRAARRRRRRSRSSRTCELAHLPLHASRRHSSRRWKRCCAGEPTSSTASCSRRRRAVHHARHASPTQAPYTSDYTYENIYYRSIAEKRERLPDALHDYPLALGHRLVLVLEERRARRIRWCAGSTDATGSGSRTYTKIMRWNSRVGRDEEARAPARPAFRVGDPGRRHPDRARRRVPRFLSSARSASGRSGSARSGSRAADRFALYPLTPGWYVNFGFWDVKRTREAHPPGHFNRLIEREGERARRHQVAVLGQLLSRETSSRSRYGGEAYAR